MPSLINDPAPKRPLKRDEKWIAGSFFVLFFGCLVWELARDFTPLKSGFLFVLLAWVPLLVLHELGHAWMARALGWQVGEVVIGHGRDWLRFSWGNTRVIFRLAPLTGYVTPIPTSLEYARLKQALIYAAGPGIELCLVGGIWAYLGGETLFSRSQELSVVLLQSFALTAAIGAAINLIPYGLRSGSVSDGLGIILSFGAQEEQLKWQLARPWAERARQLIDNGELDAALAHAEEGLRELPEHPRLRLTRARCLAYLGNDVAAVEQLEAFGSLNELSPLIRAEILVTGAEIALAAGSRERSLDARRLADLALEIYPSYSTAKLLRGAALIELEQLETGIEAIEELTSHAETELELELAYAWLAIGFTRLGRRAQAQLYFQELIERKIPSRIEQMLEEVKVYLSGISNVERSPK